MHFSVVFESHESYDLSYSLVFTPVPVWKKGDKELVNLHRDRPHYEVGDLAPLLKLENVEAYLAPDAKNAYIIVHRTGHGTPEYLATLQADLRRAGFTTRIAEFM